MAPVGKLELLIDRCPLVTTPKLYRRPIRLSGASAITVLIYSRQWWGCSGAAFSLPDGSPIRQYLRQIRLFRLRLGFPNRGRPVSSCADYNYIDSPSLPVMGSGGRSRSAPRGRFLAQSWKTVETGPDAGGWQSGNRATIVMELGSGSGPSGRCSAGRPFSGGEFRHAQGCATRRNLRLFPDGAPET